MECVVGVSRQLSKPAGPQACDGEVGWRKARQITDGYLGMEEVGGVPSTWSAKLRRRVTALVFRSPSVVCTGPLVKLIERHRGEVASQITAVPHGRVVGEGGGKSSHRITWASGGGGRWRVRSLQYPVSG